MGPTQDLVCRGILGVRKGKALPLPNEGLCQRHEQRHELVWPEKQRAAKLPSLLRPPNTLQAAELVADRVQCEAAQVSGARSWTSRGYEANNVIFDAAEFLHARRVDDRGVGIGSILLVHTGNRSATHERELVAALRS